MYDRPALVAVYGVLLNFKSELLALGDAVNQPPYKTPPRAPVLYIKPANTWIGEGDSIPVPAGEPAIQIGATLGIVFGKPAVRVSEQQALDYVAGYRIVNDVRLPHASYFRPAIKQLCRDGFCSLSEVIDRNKIRDVDALTIRSYVNGKPLQQSNTGDLIRSVPKLIADVTEFMTLAYGDVLLIGVAEGRPSAGIGNRVTIEIEGIGRLENIVGAAA
jgi:5-oxopent-3-ene-1,2,5-tricarboxylate decarboxylase/2-hydroxyhepta-2,4-diene-1,7-dioate isomerase